MSAGIQGVECGRGLSANCFEELCVMRGEGFERGRRIAGGRGWGVCFDRDVGYRSGFLFGTRFVI